MTLAQTGHPGSVRSISVPPTVRPEGMSQDSSGPWFFLAASLPHLLLLLPRGKWNYWVLVPTKPVAQLPGNLPGRGVCILFLDARSLTPEFLLWLGCALGILGAEGTQWRTSQILYASVIITTPISNKSLRNKHQIYVSKVEMPFWLWESEKYRYLYQISTHRKVL
jgi:hypothetical protein